MKSPWVRGTPHARAFGMEMPLSYHLTNLINAIAADEFTFKIGHILEITAENASWHILLQRDTFWIHVNFNGISNINMKCASQFNG